jgi:hypothetical protein
MPVNEWKNRPSSQMGASHGNNSGSDDDVLCLDDILGGSGRSRWQRACDARWWWWWWW